MILIDPATGQKFKTCGTWHSTRGGHGDCWIDVGRVEDQATGMQYPLHRLGSAVQYRAIDIAGPYHAYYINLEKVS